MSPRSCNFPSSPAEGRPAPHEVSAHLHSSLSVLDKLLQLKNFPSASQREGGEMGCQWK